MKNVKGYIAASCIALTTCLSPAVMANTVDAPPIEHFAKHAQFRNIELSPDGKHFAATVVNAEGRQALSIMDRKTFKVISTLDWKGREIPGRLYWLNDERIAVEVVMKAGSRDQPFRTGEVVAMNLDGKKKKMLFGFRSENKERRSSMYMMNMLPNDKKHILIGTIPATRKGGYAEAYKMNIYTGKKRKVERAPAPGGYLLSDNNAEVRFATGSTDTDGVNLTHIYYREPGVDKWEKLYTFNPDEGSMRPLAFAPDNKRVYVRSDLNSKTAGVHLFDPATRETTIVASHPVVDIEDLDFGPNDKLYAAHFEPDYSTIKVVDENHGLGRWYPTFEKTFKNQKIRITSSTKDMNEMIIRTSSDKNPASFYMFNAEHKMLEPIMDAAPWLQKAAFGTTEAFKFKSRDGLDVYGFVTLPKGKSKNLPMIVIPHGGPHGPRDYWTYDPDVQVLATRGYAVLKVNFRGSGGYGLDFQRKGYLTWGENIMNDITDAALWAVEQGIADKERMCIYGASFGGYASLMSVVKEPDLYKCAVGYVGVYDMDIMHNVGNIPSTQSGRNYLNKVLGRDEAKLDKFSPARHVDKIKADLFIVHGEKDKQAHYDNALFLRKQLDKIGKPYEWMTKPGEAHGFYNEKNTEELYEKMLAFFEKNIGKKL